MAAPKVSDQIFGKCSAAMSIDASRCDGLTAANIEATTASQLATIYKGSNDAYRIMGMLLEPDFMGKSCFPRQFGMYDWLQATAKRAGPKRLTLSKINYGLSELYPFVKMERKGPINNEYWTATAGASASTPTGTTWKFTVKSQTGIPGDVRWFPVGLRVSVSGRASDGTHSQTQYQVMAVVVNGTDANALDISVKSLNTASFLAGNKKSDPTTGLLTRNTPNVSDYENYCPQIPGINTNQLSPFWIETTRWSYVFCELMEKYLDAIRKNNPYFREFADVPSVELNRQIQQDFERRFAWSFFFNKPLPNQTLELYGNLEQIKVAGIGATLHTPTEGQTVGRRAAAIGIYEQHAECGRVFDLQGQTLNLQEWFNSLYQIQRVRQGNGQESRIIEVYTDDAYAIKLQQGLIRYFDMRSEGLLRINMDLSAKVEQGPFGFRFRRFQLDFPNVELRIVTNDFFNDLAQAHSLVASNLITPGRVLWVIDWSTNYEMIFDANSVMLTSGDINRLAEVDATNYGCVMKLPRNRQKLMSKTLSFISECPQASQFIENFADAVPEHRGPGGIYGDLYGVTT